MSGILGAILSRAKLRRCAFVGDAPLVLGRVWIHGQGILRIGSRVVLDGRIAPIEIHAMYPASEIVIGDDVVIGSGTSIEVEESARIGDRVRIGAFCRIMDSHFHPTTGDRSRRPQPSPVTVDADARMGSRSILLAGAYVGEGAIICAGTVVTRRLRPRVTVRGAPCQIVNTDASGAPAR